MAVEREYILVYSINISRKDAVVMLKRQVAPEIAGSVGAWLSRQQRLCDRAPLLSGEPSVCLGFTAVNSDGTIDSAGLFE